MKNRTYLSTILCLASLSAGLLAASAATFVPVNGTYNGLFYETNGYWQQSSGFFTLTTTSRGKYTGRLQIGSSRYSFSGYFDANGQASKDILRRYQNPLAVQFQVDPEDVDLIYGTITDGENWTADLIADRAVYNGRTSISPDAGQYTMLIPGDFTSTNSPGGDGYGTITIDKAGKIRFAGTLADGTKVSQSTAVSKGGNWPLYASFFHGEGALYGWMLFNGSSEEDLSGDVTWIKPEVEGSWYYPDGFAVVVSAWGSHYARPPKGTKVLNLDTATVEFNGADLSRGITNHVSLDSYNRVANHSANGLGLTFSLSNGTFSGRVMHPVTWKWISFKGVVLQRFNVAAGYFPGWNETGEVWLQEE